MLSGCQRIRECVKFGAHDIDNAFIRLVDHLD
jgi:hypothetical protein